MRILSVVGARPNFMKLAPVARALARRGAVDHVVVHTGQHYDESMSDVFFTQLAMQRPHYNLNVGSGTHGKQTAAVLERFEVVCNDLAPDWVFVYGDVNSTVAAALAAVKLGVKVAHVEAGLRSRDRTMPEEHNRVVTDHLSDLLFAPSRDAVDNLRSEGIPVDAIQFVGNVMIDTLIEVLPSAKAARTPERMGIAKTDYVVVTLHRPANVDARETFRQLVKAMVTMSRERPVVFPVHPRSRASLETYSLMEQLDGVMVLEPLPYVDMISLINGAAVVVTDSGGVQEETTYLGIPCLTVRPNTERPVTLTHGTNQLVPPLADELVERVRGAQNARRRCVIERWDGLAAERIAQVVCEERSFD